MGASWVGATVSGADARDGCVSRSTGACFAGASAVGCGAGSVVRGAGASDDGASYVGVLRCLVGSGAADGSAVADGCGVETVWRGVEVAGVSWVGVACVLAGAEVSSFGVVGAGATDVVEGAGALVVAVPGGPDVGVGSCDGSVEGAGLVVPEVARGSEEGAGVKGGTVGSDGGVKSSGTSLGGAVGAGTVSTGGAEGFTSSGDVDVGDFSGAGAGAASSLLKFRTDLVERSLMRSCDGRADLSSVRNCARDASRFTTGSASAGRSVMRATGDQSRSKGLSQPRLRFQSRYSAGLIPWDWSQRLRLYTGLVFWNFQS